jgi:hypothetical protein
MVNLTMSDEKRLLSIPGRDMPVPRRKLGLSRLRNLANSDRMLRKIRAAERSSLGYGLLSCAGFWVI